MPAYSFDRRFVPFVLDGSKTHTIRARGKRARPKVGQIAHCYTGLRTKEAKLLGRWRIVKVQDVRFEMGDRQDRAIGWSVRLKVWIDGTFLDLDEMETLFRRDGFRDTGSTAVFQASEFILERLELPFVGYIIHWDLTKPAYSPAFAKHFGEPHP